MPPEGMIPIPEGSFEMAGPPHQVFVSEFAMDTHEVTKELWDSVRQWSLDHGYLDLPTGESFGGGHPVHTVNWFDCVKWCNARSEMEGMKPAYYVDAALKLVYRAGRLSPHVDWHAGYRLPTEAEWEKAARGGANGHRFPWSDSETITPDRANYDESEKSGSMKVGSYPPNGFGLYDMAGNHFEWCWDRFAEYTSEPQSDPRGPATGVNRVFRGGSWYDNAKNCEIAHRRIFTPDTVYNRVGFRSVLPRPARPWVESESKTMTLDSHPRIIVDGREVDADLKVGDRAVVRLVHRFERGQVFYTVDGSRPSVTSMRSAGEFTVDRSVVIRELHLNEELTQSLELPGLTIQVVPGVRLELSQGGEGRIECSPQRDRYLVGDSVRLRAVAAPGWRLARWEGDLRGEALEASLTMTTGRSVRAVFEQVPRHTLRVESRGGTVTGSGTYPRAERVTVKATAPDGWSFLGWSGDHVGNEPALIWEVTSPARLVATFGTRISTVATGGGRIVLEPQQEVYPHGTVVRVVAVPDPGYGLVLWGGAGAGQQESEWTLTVTNANPKISALFTPVLKPCP
jgi:formylglycine-generating enzyme required for sulfatase activity